MSEGKFTLFFHFFFFVNLAIHSIVSVFCSQLAAMHQLRSQGAALSPQQQQQQLYLLHQKQSLRAQQMMATLAYQQYAQMQVSSIFPLLFSLFFMWIFLIVIHIIFIRLLFFIA
jgi:hypothetical protein